MAVNLGQTQDYYRGYENGKQESAACIAKLEADVARKDAALEAADKAIEGLLELAAEACGEYWEEVNNNWIADRIKNGKDARALIRKAKGEPK